MIIEKTTKYTNINYIKYLTSESKTEAIKELATVLDYSVCRNYKRLCQDLLEREKLMSTGFGYNIAAPHVKKNYISKITYAVGISKKGIDFDSIDKKPVQLIILVVADAQENLKYIHLLSKITKVLRNEAVKNSIINSRTIQEVFTILNSHKIA